MQYLAVALSALVAMVPVISLQPAYSDKALNIVVLLYPPSNCNIDFDNDFWAHYDAAMAAEWGIYSQTMCLDRLTEVERVDLQKSLQKVGLNVIVMSTDNPVIDGLNDRANGIAQPSNNFGAVDFNYNESTKTLSHETLHLILEETGTPKSCYVDAVHENANRFARYDNLMILAHFDC